MVGVLNLRYIFSKILLDNSWDRISFDIHQLGSDFNPTNFSDEIRKYEIESNKR